MPIINFNSNLVQLVANYFGKIWNLLSVFLFVPLYIYYLGIENYAIIGFYTLILGIISFADAGMSSAITREFSLNEDPSNKYYILKKIESIYWIIVLILSTVIIYFSSFISKNWLISQTIPINDLTNYIVLIGIGSSIQLISSLYFGALFGLGEQVNSNLYQIVWTTFRSLIVIILFIIINKSLYLFFTWQIICNICYIVALRIKIVKSLKKEKLSFISIKKPLPNRIIKYISGMTIVAIISSINSQADKLVISYYFNLKIFGYYSIVSTLAQIPILAITPLASFVFPILSKYATKGGIDKFTFIFQKFAFLLNLVVIPLTIIICFYPLDLLLLWTKSTIDINLYQDLSFLIISLMIGSLFLAIQFPFYYMLLAKSKTKYTIYQGIIQIFTGLPLLILCAKDYGIKFVGIPWIIINIFAFSYLSIICFKKYLNTSFSYYVINFFFPNFVISTFFALFGCILHSILHWYFLIFMFFSFILSLVTILLWNNYLNRRELYSYNHLYNFPRD